MFITFHLMMYLSNTNEFVFSNSGFVRQEVRNAQNKKVRPKIDLACNWSECENVYYLS